MNIASLNSFLESAFSWTWKTSLAATVLFALVVLVQFAFGKVLPARWRYALGLLVVLRLLLPVAPASQWSIFNLATHRPPPIQAVLPPTAPFHSSSTPIISANPVTVPIASIPTPPLPPARHVNVWAVVAWVWLAGFAALLAIAARQYFHFVRKLGRWERVREPRVLELLEICRRTLGIRRDITVLAATGLDTPALFGVLRPRLLLPAGLLARLDTGELRHVLHHELVHLKRGDLLVNWAMILLRAAHWFNPVLWFAFRRLRADQELACDAAVLARLGAGEQRSYGRTLIKILDGFSGPALCPGLVPFVTNKKVITRRITMISKFKATGRAAGVVSFALVLALGAFTFTRAEEQDAAKPQAAAPGIIQGSASAQMTGSQPMVADAQTSEQINRGEFEEVNRQLEDATSRYQANLRQYPDNSPLLADLRSKIDELEAKKIQLQAQYAQLASTTQNDTGLPTTNSPEDEMKQVEDKLRLTQDRLKDLQDANEAYFSKFPLDPTGIITRLNESVADAEVQRSKDKSLLEQLRPMSQDQLRQALPTTIPDSILSNLIQAELAAEAKLAEERSNLGEGNPDVKATEAVMKKLDEQIRQRVRGIMDGLQAQVNASDSTIKSLNSQISDMLNRQKEMAARAPQIQEMQRQLQDLQARRQALLDAINAINSR